MAKNRYQALSVVRISPRKIGIAEHLVADEVDAANLGDVALIDLEDQIDAVLIQRDDLGLDRRREAAASAVDIEDALGVGLHLGRGVDDARPQLDFGLQVASSMWLFPSNASRLMIGFSTTGTTRIVAFAAEAHVGEQAGGEQVLERLVDARRIELIAGAELHVRTDGLGLDTLIALDPDVGDRLAGKDVLRGDRRRNARKHHEAERDDQPFNPLPQADSPKLLYSTLPDFLCSPRP